MYNGHFQVFKGTNLLLSICFIFTTSTDVMGADPPAIRGGSEQANGENKN